MVWLLAAIGFVFIILSITLFFKVWEMCNDVRNIADYILSREQRSYIEQDAIQGESSLEQEKNGERGIDSLAMVVFILLVIAFIIMTLCTI